MGISRNLLTMFLLGCSPVVSGWSTNPAKAQGFECMRGGDGCGTTVGSGSNSLLNSDNLTRSEIMAVQDALIWTGFYNGLKDGVWGTRIEQALREWKRANGLAPGNASSRGEIFSLLSEAASAREVVAWRTITDQRSGANIGYPARFVSPIASQSGTDFSGNVGVEMRVRRYRQPLQEVRASLETLSHAPDVVRINYRLDRPSRQVVSYDVPGDSTVYVRADRVGEDWVGFSVKAPHQPAYKYIINAVSAGFDASGTKVNQVISEMPTLGPIMNQAEKATTPLEPQGVSSQAALPEPRTRTNSTDDPASKQIPSYTPVYPRPEPPPSTQVASAFSSRDIANIVATNRSNEIRFARDFKGKSFSGLGLFKSASEAILGGGFNFSVETEGGELYCNISDPVTLKIAVDWNRGQPVLTRGVIKTTIIGVLVLDNGCSITAQ